MAVNRQEDTMDKSSNAPVESNVPIEEESYGPNRENPCFAPVDWDPRGYDIQAWLHRSPWRLLKDTDYGCRSDVSPPLPCLYEDALLAQVYKMDIATFLTAERVSMLGISALVSSAPDEAAQVFLATQAVDEARHYEVFCRRLADFGVTPAQRERLIEHVTTPEMKRFYDLIREQVDKRDFVGAMLAHNVILEGMAYPVYRYETRYWSKIDPGLAQIIQGAFADEVQHVGFGENITRQYARGDVAARNRVNRLVRDFHRLMTEVFEAVIRHHIGIYQEAANGHMDIMGDIEIFPGRPMATVTEEEQVRLLLYDVQDEHARRLKRIDLGV